MRHAVRLLSAALVLVTTVVSSAAPSAPADIAGAWIGSIATDRGDMQIGLTLALEKGALTGAVNTSHGDWPVKSVVEKDGEWTVTFSNGGREGRMKGRIAEGKFSGTFDNAPMATGTFALVRPKKRG
jgi:hypothetical protein